jgi:hypothetical protein
MTLAKLHNLKVAMSYMTTMGPGGDGDTQLSQAGIIEFMVQQGEHDASRESPFVDGWNNEMRLRGGYDSYEIRSSGPDEVFDTEDDIYLAGNPDSEHIIDGVKELYTSPRELVKGAGRVPFQEPNGYYRVTLPGKHTIVTSYSGWRSEVMFRYNSGNFVLIGSEPDGGVWTPERSLDRRLRGIENGMDENYRGYEVVESSLSTLYGAAGLEILLRQDDTEARLIEFVSRDGLHYSISIVASGRDRRYVMDTLTEAVRTGFEAR